MKQFRLFLGITALSTLMSFSGEPPKEWLMLKSSDYSIQYPPNWRTDKSGLLGTKFILFSPSDSIGIRSFISLSQQEESGDTISLDSIANINKSNLPYSIENFKLISKEIITVQNRAYFRLNYTGIQNKRDMQWIQQGCIVRNQYYVLTFTATKNNFEKLSKKAIDILDTFTIL